MQEHTLSQRENYRLSICAQKQMQIRNEAILMDYLVVIYVLKFIWNNGKVS